MNHHVDVMLVDDGSWHVKRAAGRKIDVPFRRQVCALAFARALAHRNGADLYLHHRDGSVVRQSKDSLCPLKDLDG